MPANNVSIAKVYSQDSTINQLQNNIVLGVSQLQNQINSAPNNGIFVTTTLKAGVNTINHNLGAVPQGFIVTDIDAASTIYRIAYAKATITLNASAPVNTIIYLF